MLNLLPVTVNRNCGSDHMQLLDTVLKTLLNIGLLGTHGGCGGEMKATSKFGETVILAHLAHTI